jgi:glycosyltransferase involved in cell wall biosynthesis
MRISVAMPTYNGEKFLREQLDSIYNQTMRPDEVVVVDDCSKDGTVDILREYQQKYGLKFYVNEQNLGYNKNFEKAIKLCTGDYIALSDQDDIWFPEKIEESYKTIFKYPSDKPALVSSFGQQVNANMRAVRHEVSGFQSGDWHLQLTRYYSQGCTLMMNRKLLEYIIPFPDDIIYDAYIGLIASMIGNREYIGKPLMYYRLHGGNSLANKGAAKQWSLKQQFHYLYAYMPFWYKKEHQYNFLKRLKKYHEQDFLPDRKAVMDKVIKIFEVGKIRRLFLFLSLDGPNNSLKLRVSLGLILKIIFFIKDEY